MLSDFRAVQRHSVDSQHDRAHGLDLHGGQRSHLRHLQAAPQGQQPDLHQPQPAHLPGRVLHHRLPPIPR